MAEIAYAVPSGTTYRPGARVGYARPGLQVTQFPTGPYLSRDLLGHNLRTYELTPSIFDGSSTTQLEAWERFLHRTNGGADPFWVVEPISQRHDRVVCGPPLDGSQQTFTVPIQDVTSVPGYIDVGGIERALLSSYIRDANLLNSDAHAMCSTSSGWYTSYATATVNTSLFTIGTASLQLVPDGVNSYPIVCPQVASSVYAVASAGDVVTALAWVSSRMTSTNFRIGVYWYDSGDSYIGSSYATETTITIGGFHGLTHTATAPASTAKVVPVVQRREASPNAQAFYVGAFAVAPGTLDVWHLPSACPSVIYMPTAYSSTGHGRIVLPYGTGRRFTRCIGRPGMSWTLDGRGSASVRSIIATEALEF